MLGYVDNNLIDVLPTELYPQFMCLNAKFFAHVCSQYVMYNSLNMFSLYMKYWIYVSIQIGL